MKVIMIGGYPGSGKSTIVNKTLEYLSQHEYKFTISKYGKLVPYMLSNRGLIVLGTYMAGEQFPGTDRFAMNAQPEVMEFLLDLKANEEGQHDKETIVLFEGDRLFNGKMLDWLYQENFNRVLCIVEAEQSLIETRRQERSKQNESWRKGRETKVDRIAMSYPVTHWLVNNTEAQCNASATELVAEIMGEWSGAKQVKTLREFWSK